MQILTLKTSVVGAWAMALIYDWIDVATGLDIKLLLYLAIGMLVIGLYGAFQGNKETTKGEA